MKFLTQMRLLLIVIAGFGFGLGAAMSTKAHRPVQQTPWWPVQAVDTMKYSRDASGQYLTDLESLRQLAGKQLHDISTTGATHVAIATPYDEMFLPVLRIWVEEARFNGLKVWFRGNWSGWEGWFDQDSIDRQQHLQLTKQFIEKNADLFVDGDIFTACPECENGGPGDPRMTGDTAGFRQFLIDEHTMMEKAFASIDRSVIFNYNSMNGDVARLIMDKPTTTALGGVVTIDHYVKTPEKLVTDIQSLAAQSGGVIVLGEIGAPIPDIHGSLTQEQQASWIQAALSAVAPLKEVVGVSYWTSQGGSTALWNEDGTPRQAVATITSFYTPQLIHGTVVDAGGRSIVHAVVQSEHRVVTTDDEGAFELPIITDMGTATISKETYLTNTLAYDSSRPEPVIKLDEPQRSFTQRVQIWFSRVWEQLGAALE